MTVVEIPFEGSPIDEIIVANPPPRRLAPEEPDQSVDPPVSPPTAALRSDLHTKLGLDLTGEWVEATDDQLAAEFPRGTRDAAEFSCIAAAGSNRTTAAKCQCTVTGLCRNMGHQRCRPGNLWVDKLKKRWSGVPASPDDEAGPTGFAQAGRLIRALRGRAMCFVGDSVALNVYAALRNELTRMQSHRRARVSIEEKPRGEPCRIPWWGCLKKTIRMQACVPPRGAQQSSAAVAAACSDADRGRAGYGTTAWTQIYYMKHYTYEPWEFQVFARSCDVILYNLARAHYANPNALGRDEHPLWLDLELALPRLAAIASSPPRNPGASRVVAYYSSLTQHFRRPGGFYSLDLTGVDATQCLVAVNGSRNRHSALARCALARLSGRAGKAPRGVGGGVLCTIGEAEADHDVASPDNEQFSFEVPVATTASPGLARAVRTGEVWLGRWADETVKNHTYRWIVYKAENAETLKRTNGSEGTRWDRASNPPAPGPTRTGKVYFLPLDYLYWNRGDGHIFVPIEGTEIKADCTHYCFNPLLFAPAWRVMGTLLLGAAV